MQYDNQSYARQRKLVALALTSLVRTTDPAILDRFDEIVTCWLSALGETEESATGEYVDCLRTVSSPYIESSSPGAAAVEFWNPSPSQTPSLASAPTPTSGSVRNFAVWGSSNGEDMAAEVFDAWATPAVIVAVQGEIEGRGLQANAKNGESWPVQGSHTEHQQQPGDDDDYWAACKPAPEADWGAVTASFDDAANSPMNASHYSADVYYNDDETEEPVELGWGDLTNTDTQHVTPGILRQNAVSLP